MNRLTWVPPAALIAHLLGRALGHALAYRNNHDRSH